MSDLNLPEVLSNLLALSTRCREGSITREDFDNIFPKYYQYFTAYGDDAEVFQLRYAMLQVVSSAVNYGIFEASVGSYYEKRVDLEYRAGAQHGQKKDNVLLLYKAYYESQSLSPDKRLAHIKTYMNDARTINSSIDFMYSFFQFVSSDTFIARIAENLAVYYAHYDTTGAKESFEDARDSIHSFALLGKITDAEEITFAAGIAKKAPGILQEIYAAIGIDPKSEDNLAEGKTRRFSE